MTRFARARGSKSSNERLPEEATSWKEMKQQLQEKQNSTKKSDSKNINKIRPHFDFKSDETSEWAEFEKPVNSVKTKKEKKKKIKHISLEQDESNTGITENDTRDGGSLHKLSQQSTKVKKKSSKKFSNKTKKVFDEVPMPDIETTIRIANEGKEIDKIKKKKKTKNITEDVSDNDKLKEDKDKKRKQRPTEDILNDENSVKQRKIKKKRIKEDNIQERNIQKNPHTFSKDSNKQYMKNNRFKTRKQKGQPYRRRKQEPPPEKMFINGREIEVVKFDGFPVKKEDAERLRELRKNLLAKGIPKDEVSITIKLERRKAEKALARERKKVCFHCRKSGHLLSECPELGDSQETGTGICFKCGSTEHTHFECKVIRGQDFRYAECFICKEQGHIARQCPDNPRGLYPKGGACKVCGDVTHLKKDCPDLIVKKENETITLQTLDDNSLEVLDEDINKIKLKSSEGKPVKKKAVVKF